MGEYARRKSDNVKIKVGTCEQMYYVRYEDRNKFDKLAGNIDINNTFDLFWRLPYPDEDLILPGDYDDYDRGIDLKNFSFKPDVMKTGVITLYGDCMRMNITCYHGHRIPENCKDFRLESNLDARDCFTLKSIKNTPQSMRLCFACKWCGQLFSTNDWGLVLASIHDSEMVKRLKQYI